MKQQASGTSPSGAKSLTGLRHDPKRFGQLLFGGIFLVAFVGYYLMANDMPYGTLRTPGPGMFPSWVGLGGIIISGIVIVESILNRGESGEIGFPRGYDLKVTLIFIATIIGYILVLPYLGMMISSILYAILFIKFGGAVSWVRSILMGGLIGAALTLFFANVLGLPLPSGMIL